MNLRVDLILPDEQRSASLFNKKTLSHVGTIIGPIILGLIIAWVVLGILALRRQVRQAESLWEQTEPKMQEANRLFKDTQGNMAVLDEFEGWANSRVPWHEHLLSIQAGISPNLRLNAIRISHSMQVLDGKTPARMYTLAMSGTGPGRTAQADVQAIRRHLSQSETFADCMETVEVPSYGADPKDKRSRIFEIQSKYQARVFE